MATDQQSSRTCESSSVPGFVTDSYSFSIEKGLRPLPLDTSDDDSIGFINGLGTSLSVEPPEISPLTNVTSDISSNIDTPVKGTSHEVLIHASPSMDNVATNTDTYTKTSAIIGYKIVGENIDKEVKPRFACSNYRTKSLDY